MSASITVKDYIFTVCFAFIFAVGVFGNLLVIYIFKFQNKRNIGAMELIITYLAVSDLIASVFNPLLYIYWHLTGFEQWDFGSFCCTLFPSITTVSVTTSLGFILLITIERCRVLTNPFAGTYILLYLCFMVVGSAFTFTTKIPTSVNSRYE